MRSLRSLFHRDPTIAGKRLTASLAIAALALFSDALLPIPALAQHSEFKSDFITVLKDCKDAHGVWSDDDGGYGCTKPNCDGKGGSCTVGCTREGDCQGNTPKIMVGKVTILMLLQNGSNVNHSNDAAQPGPVSGSGTGGGGGAVGGPPSFF